MSNMAQMDMIVNGTDKAEGYQIKNWKEGLSSFVTFSRPHVDVSLKPG